MPKLSLAWSLARRELRGGLAGFRVFLACLALGVGAIAAVGWTGSAIVGGLAADARKLLGGDVELRLVHQTASPDQLAYLSDNTDALSSSVQMRAMAVVPNGGERALVQLKAVDNLYPLVGTLELSRGGTLSDALTGRGDVPGAVVDPNLMDRLGLEIGETVRIGKAPFVIMDTITREPDRVTSMINFGPRFMIAEETLNETGLVQPGSLIRYYYRGLLPTGDNAADWRATLELAFPDAGWRVRGTDEAAPGVRRFIDRLTLFMSFVGYTVLLVGGVGITRAVTAYLESKTRTIASLKCLGADAGLIVAIYLIQVGLLGALGIVLGLIGGIALPAALLAAFGDTLPVRPMLDIYPLPILIAAAFGVLIAITAALWPLGRARQVPARDLFRAAAQPLVARPPMAYLVWLGLGTAALTALVLLTASNIRFAIWFIIGAAVTFAALRLAAASLIAASRKVKSSNAIVRLVMANVNRPGTAAPGIVLSLGLGLSVLVAVVQIEGNITGQISDRLPDAAPSYFFLDIQPHQVAEFDRIVTTTPGTADFQREPVIRGRIVQIDGQPVANVDVAPDSRWAIRGDRSLTTAATMPDGTEMVAGEWWPSDYAGPPLISLDASLAQGFDVTLGDTLTINVLGREFTATIASLRAIDWGSMRFDFAVVFSPGVLEGAPHTHIAAVRATEETEKDLERAVTDAFDNVSAVHVREALQAATDLLAGIGAAIRAVAGMTVIAGAVVLAGALAAGQRRRTFDSVVFKVLGATRKRIALTFILEYGVLGLITGLAAIGVGTLTAWAVITLLMNMEWVFLPVHAGATVILALIATVGFGLAGSWRILGMKTAPYLRND